MKVYIGDLGTAGAALVCCILIYGAGGMGTDS